MLFHCLDFEVNDSYFPQKSIPSLFNIKKAEMLFIL